MPNRIIKESICTSDTLDSLGWFDEVVFYRLIVNCDDFGRFDGRIPVLRSRLFPLKQNITDKSLMESINRLATVGLVMLYEYDSKPILQLLSWDKHQQIRSKKSKYPAFDDTCKQLISNDIKCPRNPIQSNPIQSESESESNTRAERFGLFWDRYPKKVGKGAAEKAFNKIKPNEQTFERMIEAVEAQKHCDQWRKDNGQYIPNPATWLNQRRWEDDLGTSPINPDRLDDLDDLF